MKQKILIVGAGAVGQVYALHFARAGHEVHLFLKEKYIAEAQKGYVLYHLNKDKKRQQPIIFKNFQCHSDWSTVAAAGIDQVWLCMATTGLAQMDLQPMANAIGDATVMVLQPSPDQIARVQAAVGADRVTAGMINMISYYAPLVTEVVPQAGVAFWIPPLAPMAVEGERERADLIVTMLKEAKIPAAYQANFANKGVHANAFLMTALAVLEANHWKFKELGADKAGLQTMMAAQQEAYAALAAHYGVEAPLALKCIKAWMIPGILFASRYVAPLDMETYLEAHFSKVRPQTVMLLQRFVELAQQQQLPHQALSALLNGMGEADVAPDAVVA